MKNNAHWRSFETVFEVYFSLRGPQYDLSHEDDGFEELMAQLQQDQSEEGQGRMSGGGAMDSLTPEELLQMLYGALSRGDNGTVRALARQAVRRFAGMAGAAFGHELSRKGLAISRHAISLSTACDLI